MALLLGVLVGFGRLSSDSEIVAMKASGLSLYQLARPVLAFALLVYALSLTLALYVRPWGNTLLKHGLYEVAKTRASVGLRERVFNADFPGLVIYVNEIAPGGSSFTGVMISDTRDADQHNTAFARVGILVSNEASQTVTLRLLDGHIETSSPNKSTFHQTEFAVYDINLNWGAALADLTAREKDPKEMTLAELRQAIRAKHDAGASAFVEQVEVHRKFSIPFACLVFAAAGMPLGIQGSRSVRSRGFSVSLVLIFVYYILLSLAENLGERGVLPPALALWLPNGAFALAGASLFSAAARERTPAPLVTVEAWLGTLRRGIVSRFTTTTS
jgi:lipopolysaccharide export system permease protein